MQVKGNSCQGIQHESKGKLMAGYRPNYIYIYI